VEEAGHGEGESEGVEGGEAEGGEAEGGEVEEGEAAGGEAASPGLLYCW
jgi:hypothetical protein